MLNAESHRRLREAHTHSVHSLPAHSLTAPSLGTPTQQAHRVAGAWLPADSELWCSVLIQGSWMPLRMLWSSVSACSDTRPQSGWLVLLGSMYPFFQNLCLFDRCLTSLHRPVYSRSHCSVSRGFGGRCCRQGTVTSVHHQDESCS